MSDERRGGILTAAVTMLTDALMLETAFQIAYWIRFYSGVWLVPLGIPSYNLYLATSGVVILVFLGIFYVSGLYSFRGDRRLVDELGGVFRSVVLGSLLVLALAFFLKREAYSRAFFGLFFVSSFVFLMVGRILVRNLIRSVARRTLGLTRILLVGASPMQARVAHLARALPGLQLEPVGWVAVPEEDDEPAPVRAVAQDGPLPFDVARGGLAVRDRRRQRAHVAEPIPTLPCLGTVAEVREVVVREAVDRVVMTLRFSQLAHIATVSEQLSNLRVDLQFVPDLFAMRVSRMRFSEVGGIPFVAVREGALSGADHVVKRTFDIVCTSAGLLLLAPVFLVLAIAVKMSSPGPVYYRQARVGRDGREFSMLKFRSMRCDAEQGSGPVWTVQDDPRVTRVGRFLRRWSLDELPQFWNVLVGDMSLVGPRPERRVFVQRFSQKMPRYFERHRVKSGLTGWAQIHGLRGNTSIEERTLYDLYYVENWSLVLDVKILLMTVHHVLRGDNAY